MKTELERLGLCGGRSERQETFEMKIWTEAEEKSDKASLILVLVRLRFPSLCSLLRCSLLYTVRGPFGTREQHSR